MKRQLTIPETYKRAKRIKTVRSLEKSFNQLSVKEFIKSKTRNVRQIKSRSKL